MPWKSRGTMSLREEFVKKAYENKFNMSELCRHYEISRTTAYKWLKRYEQEGEVGLLDRSRRPCHSPLRISTEQVEIILNARKNSPAWGAKKLRQTLINEGFSSLPSIATFNRVLLRHGKIDKEESTKRQHFIRFERLQPNELWQMDFKGHFKMVEGRCHPLTVIDDHSRYVVCLRACITENEESVRCALEETFRTHGLPEAMTMDNGSPWKGSPPYRLSRLTIWLMRLGIQVSHSSPRHPQTQGKDERFHRSLKDEVLKFHQFKDIKEAQHYFDHWLQIYNHKRPHEGIGMACPIQRYKPSLKPYPNKLPTIEYRPEDLLRKVRMCGQISYHGKDYFVGEHLCGETVALRQTGNKRWDIYYCNARVASFSIK